MLFYAKQHVVRSISRDIFQIISDEIFISSEEIGKKSDKIAKGSRIRVKFVGRMILNSHRAYSFLPRLPLKSAYLVKKLFSVIMSE